MTHAKRRTVGSSRRKEKSDPMDLRFFTQEIILYNQRLAEADQNEGFFDAFMQGVDLQGKIGIRFRCAAIPAA